MQNLFTYRKWRFEKKILIKTIKSNGCVFVRHGDNHDWYQNPQSRKNQPIARHAVSYLRSFCFSDFPRHDVLSGVFNSHFEHESFGFG